MSNTKRYHISPEQSDMLKGFIESLYNPELVTHDDDLWNIYLPEGQSVIISQRTGLVTVYEDKYDE